MLQPMKIMVMMVMKLIVIIITISSLRQCLSNIPGKHEIKELQTTAILCTAQTLREVLM